MAVTPEATRSEQEGGDDVIEISIPFTAVICPNCEVPREAGPCPECSYEVPAPEIDEHAKARAGAFRPLADQLAALEKRFDQIDDGEIPLTPDQFLQAMAESDIFERAREMIKIGPELSQLDFADHKVVGGQARNIVAEHMGRVEGLLELCEEIGRFRPEPPADQLRALAIDTGRYGVEIARAFVGAIAAQTFDEARSQAALTEELLSGFPFEAAISAALEKLEPLAAPDLNRRLALALGTGDFIDEDDNLDIGRILVSFADEEEPLSLLAERAEIYFSHLIDGPSSGDGSAAIVLPSLALVANSERPLRTHSAARLLKEALTKAVQANKQATLTVIDRTTAQGALIYTALSRVERAVNRLDIEAEAEQAVDHVMSTYRNLTETTFRTIGWLSVSLDLILDGKALPSDAHPPMLGELCQRLAAGSELSQLIAESVDPGLRNAEAHSQYQWISKRGVVKDLRTGQEWSADELGEALLILTSCVAGADAGYGCFVIGEGMSGEMPDWLREDETPIALEMLATLCFAPYGHEIDTLADGGGTVILSKVGSRDPARLIPPLGGMAILCKPKAFCVRTVDDEVLVEVPADAVMAAVSPQAAFKDLSMLDLTYEISRTRASDTQQVDEEFAAFAAKVLGVTGLRSLAGGQWKATMLSDLRDRLNWVADFVKRLDAGQTDLAFLRKRLSKTRSSLSKASRGASGSVESLVSQLTQLVEWAEATGFRWPPKAE